MSLIKQVKDLQISSRKEKNKDAVSALTMLISRADNDRVKYGLKSTDEMTDEQVLKVIQAEIKSIDQEISFLKDEEKIAKLTLSKELLSRFVPAEVSAEELEQLIYAAIALNAIKPNIGEVMKNVPILYQASGGDKTIPKGLLSTLVKKILAEI